MAESRIIRVRFKSPKSLRTSSPFRLELAVTPDEHAQGLMHRELLLENGGMLFTFAHEGLHGFWMKNTKLPLDIAWLSAAGVVQEIAQLTPHDIVMRRPRLPAKYAVEVNAGAFTRYGVNVGDQMLIFRERS